MPVRYRLKTPQAATQMVRTVSALEGDLVASDLQRDVAGEAEQCPNEGHPKIIHLEPLADLGIGVSRVDLGHGPVREEPTPYGPTSEDAEVTVTWIACQRVQKAVEAFCRPLQDLDEVAIAKCDSSGDPKSPVIALRNRNYAIEVSRSILACRGATIDQSFQRHQVGSL